MGLPDVVSLLWRLGLLGVRGLPWGIAHKHAELHFSNGSNVFGELHLTMLAAVRADRPALVAAVSRLKANGERGHSGALVAVRWAQALIALLDGDRAAAREHFDACSDGAARLGGSHAQRCIVAQTRDALQLPG
jgi:hypothetical protein